MKHLSVLDKYFWKYRAKFFLGILFILLSNYFRILGPQVSGHIVNKLAALLGGPARAAHKPAAHYDFLVRRLIQWESGMGNSFGRTVVYAGIVLLFLALVSGLFMFLMRQTIIVMSRLIEYDQKNEVYAQYQRLDVGFYRSNATGDLMNRISEDVGRVRMYTGPAIMYFINLTATIGFSIYYMWAENPMLTLYVLSPLPFLALVVYKTTAVINEKSGKVQALLSDLTTAAQESYSGIRVVKSFAQEHNMSAHFRKLTATYRDGSIGLAKVEALFFPSMALMIGASIVLSIGIGGWYHASGRLPIVSAGTIAEFVIYVNMLSFPVTAIGWTASLVQRAAASQKRINEFLSIVPTVQNNPTQVPAHQGISLRNLSMVYPNTGIRALDRIDLELSFGKKVLVIGKTGSGKSTLAQMLLRFYDCSEGELLVGGAPIATIDLIGWRNRIGYVPQDVFLFSDTIANNIAFGTDGPPDRAIIEQAAKMAKVHDEIMGFPNGYDTLVGERGVTLSGGQKQRISMARAFLRKAPVLLLDDCLSAVDAGTESHIAKALSELEYGPTLVLIAHKIPSHIVFDEIIVLSGGGIAERGTHISLLEAGGSYAKLYRSQVEAAPEGALA